MPIEVASPSMSNTSATVVQTQNLIKKPENNSEAQTQTQAQAQAQENDETDKILNSLLNKN